MERGNEELVDQGRRVSFQLVSSEVSVSNKDEVSNARYSSSVEEKDSRPRSIRPSERQRCATFQADRLRPVTQAVCEREWLAGIIK
jgi:hypothetical protein